MSLITARIVYLKTSERHDALGNKLVFSGMLEDSTFKVPFVSHRISYPLIRNSVYKFYSAYVHEFEDKSVLLVVTEHTKIEPKNIEDYREFVWAPKIESIKRPVHHIALQGVITTIHNNSGLVKRCNKCKSILYDSCPNNVQTRRMGLGSASLFEIGPWLRIDQNDSDQGHCIKNPAEKFERIDFACKSAYSKQQH